MDGIKINDTNKLKAEGFSLADINNKLFESFGHQIFQTGFVHADPHPGNGNFYCNMILFNHKSCINFYSSVMVRRKNGKTELIILDHGLYQLVSEQERVALSHFWKAIVLNDHQQMQLYSKALGVQGNKVNHDYEFGY